MKKKINNIRFIACVGLLMFGSINSRNHKQAVVIVPVADLVGSPINTWFPNRAAAQAYAHIPLCGGTLNPFDACPRLHQLLFNQIVEVSKETEHEIEILAPTIFYITKASTTPHNSFWMLKKDVMFLNNLKDKHVDLSKFPPTISFAKKENNENQNVVTLMMPFKDSKSGVTYSAGTRFIKNDAQSTKTMIAVYVFDPKTFNFTLLKIPRDQILPKVTSRTAKINLFVALIQRWCHLNAGFIPYVWGGSSFVHTSSSPSFIEEETTVNDKKATFFKLNDFAYAKQPGFDCSNLICFAAQMCDIPFFYKNSTTIAHYLKPLQPNESVSSGDIMWINRHVMVIGSLEKNTLLEARHYFHGYGKVMEIPLHKVFKDMNTYADLMHAYRTHQALYRLRNTGEVAETIPTFKLLKMASVWETH